MIFDIIIILQNSALIYLLYRIIPDRQRKEIVSRFGVFKRKVIRPKSFFIEWVPPEEPENRVFKKILKSLKK